MSTNDKSFYNWYSTYQSIPLYNIFKNILSECCMEEAYQTNNINLPPKNQQVFSFRQTPIDFAQYSAYQWISPFRKKNRIKCLARTTQSFLQIYFQQKKKKKEDDQSNKKKDGACSCRHLYIFCTHNAYLLRNNK